jgi:Flp pilus assembly protein CpaB
MFKETEAAVGKGGNAAMKRWLFRGAVLVVTLVTGFVLGVYLGPKLGLRTDDSGATESVLVAQTEVRPGTYLTEPEKLFTMQPVARASLPTSAIRDFKSLRKKLVQRRIAAGDICTVTDFAESERHFSFAGARAVTLRFTPDGALADFVVPGSHVNVIQRTLLPDGELESKVSVENVLTLSVCADRNGTVPPPGDYLLALALTSEQAELVLLASKEGPLNLAATAGNFDAP